jgi:hypothetical protein
MDDLGYPPFIEIPHIFIINHRIQLFIQVDSPQEEKQVYKLHEQKRERDYGSIDSIDMISAYIHHRYS